MEGPGRRRQSRGLWVITGNPAGWVPDKPINIAVEMASIKSGVQRREENSEDRIDAALETEITLSGQPGGTRFVFRVGQPQTKAGEGEQSNFVLTVLRGKHRMNLQQIEHEALHHLSRIGLRGIRKPGIAHELP